MLSIENDTVLVDKQTTKLQGFRLEDTRRAPVIIIFVDQNKPELLPLRPGQPVPVKVKSQNMETEIQIITYDEIDDYMDKA